MGHTYDEVKVPIGVVILLELEGGDAELLLAELLRGRYFAQQAEQQKQSYC